MSGYIPKHSTSPPPTPRAYESAKNRFITLESILEKEVDKGQESRSERILLLLSTCRNIYLTVNAVFATLRTVLGQGTSPSCVERIVFAIKAGDFKSLDKAINDETGLAVLLDNSKDKIHVWESRKELYDGFTDAARRWSEGDSAHESLAASFIADLNSPPQKLDEQFLRFDLEFETGETLRLLDVLRSCIEKLEHIKALAQTTSKLLRWAIAPQRELFLTKEGQDEVSLRMLLRDLNGSAQALAWRSSFDDGARSVQLPGQPDNGLPAVTLDGNTLQADPKGTIQILGDWISVEISKIRAFLAAEFRPNSITRPMPDPFVVDFSGLQNDVSSKSGRRLAIKEVNIATAQDEEVTIAVAAFPVAVSHYRTGYLDYKNDDCRESVWRAAVEAVQRASEQGAVAIVFPELFFPRTVRNAESADSEGHLRSLAKMHNIIIIGGLECRMQNAELVNEALVAFPSGEVSRQRKQDPSPYEPSDQMFASDGELKIFTNTQCGTFGILICKDFLENDIVQGFEQSPQSLDVLFVLAYNPQPELFQVFARADSVRLFRHVVLAHTEVRGDEVSSSGTSVVSPNRVGKMVQEVSPESDVINGDDLFEGGKLWLSKVPIGPLKTARNGRQAKDLFTAPTYVKSRRMGS